MSGINVFTGKAVGMDRVNVDTDQIIPKQFLKRIEKTGFGQFLFYDWRFLKDGSPDPKFELNLPENEGASILVANENFGCGSSREHAPWALQDYGFKVIIAPSFADIFYQNCLKNGVLPIATDQFHVRRLFKKTKQQPCMLTVSLEEKTVKSEGNILFSFDIHPHWRMMLMNGLDEIALTMQLEDDIKKFEAVSR
ncbi:3-isopropylmalate dehydratase small subunit [Mesobacillus zeae]|uniref:3-isopropylmalate dehydratase small subunit n=1 Tax=Mesobacillus zeae TaxID=1917180 RepID=A0A398B6D1_9BACI|nr:3-isopropylmalate dehydratase small subunit [Mesobacillus zeae]RID83243.1 3-isopropylmalate dehydratase small subunit [Mesobacillus zeae]